MGTFEQAFDSCTVALKRFFGEADTSQAHEKAHLIFSSIITSRLPQMGLSAFDIFSVGGTRFTGNTNSKEADSAFKPLSRERTTDWPTLVIESGMSESLARLRVDAPVKMQDINITSDIVIGAPLILGFEKIFLRQPQLPEQDFHFSVQDLQNIARHLWSGIE